MSVCSVTAVFVYVVRHSPVPHGLCCLTPSQDVPASSSLSNSTWFLIFSGNFLLMFSVESRPPLITALWLSLPFVVFRSDATRDGTQGFGGMSKPFHRRYVVSQAVQIMETAVVNNAAALSTFRELGAAEVRLLLSLPLKTVPRCSSWSLRQRA